MPYTSFHFHFPELAKKETCTLTILREDDVIPKGSYGLVEMYCDDFNCDCRRVFLEIYDWEHHKPLAYIAYGWESAAFYRKRLNRDDPKTNHSGFARPDAKFSKPTV